MARIPDLSKVVYSKLARAATIAAARLDFRLRRLCHPEISFSDFYVEKVIRTIDSGRVHRTLAKNYWLRDGIDAKEREDLLQAFRRNGLHRFEALVNYGLASHHSCVDYGCGMLRVGQHLIRFLDRANYWGLDVTDRFMRDGLELLETGLVEDKAPHLHVIQESVIAALEHDPPDFVFSNAVLKHGPPFELDTFFDNFLRLVGARTRAFIFFEEAAEQRQIAGAIWVYPAEFLINKVRSRNPSRTVGLERSGWVLGRSGPSRLQSVLRISGKDCLAGLGFDPSFGGMSYADHYVVRNAALEIPPAVLPTNLWRGKVTPVSTAYLGWASDRERLLHLRAIWQTGKSAQDTKFNAPRRAIAPAPGIAANTNEKEAIGNVGRVRRWESRLGGIAAAAVLVVCACTAATLAIRDSSSDAEISGVASAPFSLNRAIATAARIDPGWIVQADFKIRDGVPGYVVTIQNSSSIDRVIIDPNSGRVLKIKIQKALPPNAAGQADISSESLLFAVSLAEEITKGKAISADFEGPNIYDIDINVDGRRELVTINAASETVQSIGPDDDI